MDNNRRIIEELNKNIIFKHKFYLILRLYSIIGFLLFFIAGSLFLLSLLPYERTSHQYFLLIISDVGLGIVLMTKFILAAKNVREDENISNKKKILFLQLWMQFEIIGEQVLKSAGYSRSILSIRNMIQRLEEMGKISQLDVYTLEKALKIRNQLVHQYKVFSDSPTIKEIAVLQSIIEKILK